MRLQAADTKLTRWEALALLPPELQRFTIFFDFQGKLSGAVQSWSRSLRLGPLTECCPGCAEALLKYPELRTAVRHNHNQGPGVPAVQLARRCAWAGATCCCWQTPGCARALWGASLCRGRCVTAC